MDCPVSHLLTAWRLTSISLANWFCERLFEIRRCEMRSLIDIISPNYMSTIGCDKDILLLFVRKVKLGKGISLRRDLQLGVFDMGVDLCGI